MSAVFDSFLDELEARTAIEDIVKNATANVPRASIPPAIPPRHSDVLNDLGRKRTVKRAGLPRVLRISIGDGDGGGVRRARRRARRRTTCRGWPGPAAFGATLQADLERWGPIVKASGFTAEE